MNLLIGILKTLMLSAVAALVLGIIGFVIASIVAEIVVPGHNPHTDQLKKLGMVIVGAGIGASLGVFVTVGIAIYQFSKHHRVISETQL